MRDDTRSIQDGPRNGSDKPADHPHHIADLYDELRALAAWHMSRQRASHTLQPTALVNEACLKLLNSGNWKSEDHFLAVASVAMRQVLVDHARKRSSSKRDAGGHRLSITIAERELGEHDHDILEFDDLLSALAKLEPRCARVAQLKLFAGMTNEQVARVLEVSRTTAVNDWAVAKAWLLAKLNDRAD